MYRCKLVLGSLLITFGLIAMAGTGVQAQIIMPPPPPVATGAGNLEPPGSAVDGSGDPVATTQTQPSWDQVLRANERFVLVMGGEGVLDKETGLVWEQSPDTTRHDWEDTFIPPVDARRHCARLGTGGRMGWRLPSLAELTSLVVPGNPVGGPDLPPGHPFSNVQSFRYWSATSNVESPTFAWLVDFGIGNVSTSFKTDTFFVWCVRGGGPLSGY